MSFKGLYAVSANRLNVFFGVETKALFFLPRDPKSSRLKSLSFNFFGLVQLLPCLVITGWLYLYKLDLSTQV